MLGKFLDDCQDVDRAAPFKSLYDGKVSASQYGSAERLIAGVCNSPAFALRCGATFDFEEFLSNKGILLIEGGSFGTLSTDALRTMLGSISLKVIDYVRSRPAPFPRVHHYLDEANNMSLVTQETECRALAELRKENYGLKIMVQQLDFPSAAVTESVLNNTATHYWFGVESSKLAQQGAADLGDPELKNSLRSLGVGKCYIKTGGQHRLLNIQRSEDPWTYPGLAAAKAEEMLEIVRQRPEYQHRSQRKSSGEHATQPSNGGCEDIPAQPGTSSISSPADRLRTAGQQNSADERPSDSSEQ